jgi:hypothetical protein
VTLLLHPPPPPALPLKRGRRGLINRIRAAAPQVGVRRTKEEWVALIEEWWERDL